MEKTPSEKLTARIIELLSLDDNTTRFKDAGDEKIVFSYCKNYHITHEEVTTTTLEEVEEAYQGEFDNMTRFAEQLVDDCGMLSEMPDNLQMYFDYEKFGRDLVWSGDYWFDEDNGFVFRSM
jgi:antirestriction protein